MVLLRTGGSQWYANLDGQGSFSRLRFIASDDSEPYLSVAGGDLHGDGNADLVFGTLLDEPLHWYRQVAPDDPAVAPDNCPHFPNPNQVDSNGNGVGDLCEAGAVALPALVGPGLWLLGLLLLATGTAWVARPHRRE